MNLKHEKFCSDLYNMGCIKFGNFILKSGKESTYYIDLRILISFPLVLEELCSLLNDTIIENKINFDTICGVPYTALPISTLVSVKSKKPMVLRRKEIKTYGTKQLIDGKFEKGNHCIIIEDVISTGSSILETIADIETVGMIVKNIIVIVDREEGGIQNIRNRGYTIDSIFSLSEILKILNEQNLVDADIIQKVQAQQKSTKVAEGNRSKLFYEQRILYTKCIAASKLFSLISEKKTNLCLAADVTNVEKLLKLANEVGPHICIFKIHADIIDDFAEKEKEELKNIAQRHNFMIMEDRKLADIGNTVQLQFNQISKWANLITVHAISGFGILEAIQNSMNFNENIGVFVIAELSSQNNLITPDYTKKTVHLAEKYPKLIAGIVCQFSSTFSNPGFIQMTPGVNIEENVTNDNLGQQYNSPETVVMDRSADIVVVGRGIINAPDPSQIALEYKKKLWNAYLKRMKKNN